MLLLLLHVVIRVVGSLIVVVCECMLELLLRMRCWLCVDDEMQGLSHGRELKK